MAPGLVASVASHVEVLIVPWWRQHADPKMVGSPEQVSKGKVWEYVLTTFEEVPSTWPDRPGIHRSSSTTRLRPEKRLYRRSVTIKISSYVATCSKKKSWIGVM